MKPWRLSLLNCFDIKCIPHPWWLYCTCIFSISACNMMKDCESCQAANLTDFTCYWCESVGRCSDTRDRGRQQWVRARCPYNVSYKLRQLWYPAVWMTQTKCHWLLYYGIRVWDEYILKAIGVLGVGILALAFSLEIGNRVIDLMKYGSALKTCLLIDLQRHHFHF